MRVSTIGTRIAHHLRDTDIVDAGLRHAYYPAPAQVPDGPAAVVFAGAGVAQPWSEQHWHHEIRVQLMMPSRGFPAAELNALETLIEPIWDLFTPGSAANQLRLAGSQDTATHCDPLRYEGSQVIEYGGKAFAALTLIFDVKTHRAVGDE